MRTVASLLLTLSLTTTIHAQQHQVDARIYMVRLTIPDTGTVIHASVAVVLRSLEDDTIRLQLEGMQVDSVWRMESFDRASGTPFRYDGHVIAVPVGSQAPTGISVLYHGSPQDGFIIGTNAHGHRVAFADNWPRRARYWIPTIDEPRDKAVVVFSVKAPTTWRVVANGDEGDPAVWGESHPIPTYTMVVGAGEFTVSKHRPANGTIPIEVWTYPEDSAYADSVPFKRATEIVEVMQRLIGPFPYENLKHVESSTRFGGMENSTAIFYAEKPYVDRRMGEGVVRHESAHQWFGDAVTERDWPDLWLSEGFATYFDGVIGAALDGDSVLAQHMKKNAEDYFASDVTDRPIVDSANAGEPMKLLNANSYPKGAWVLHMLRGLMGDSAFFRGLRTYYRTYRDSNATSDDFERVMEKEARAEYGWFFRQWLHQPGYPQLDVTWRYDTGARRVFVGITQRQKPTWGLFRLPVLTVEFRSADGAVERRNIEVGARHVDWNVVLPFAPAAVRVDPDGKLLLQATAVAGR